MSPVARRPSPRRRAIALVGTLVVLLAVGASGYVAMRLARQGRRASDWYYRSQSATNLAHVALRETLTWMQWAYSPERADQSEFLRASLLALADQLEAPTPGARVDLVTMATLAAPAPDGPPPVLLSQVQALAALAPDLRVWAEVVEFQPFDREALGFPQDLREGAITLRLVSEASVGSPVGARVSRRITAENKLKSVNVLPEPFGRFALWVAQAPSSPDDLNFVPMQFLTPESAPAESDSWGSARVQEGQPWPLKIVQPEDLQQAVVAEGGRSLDRQPLADAASGTAALDRAGWVFLGGGKWTLNLAHGFGEDGEAHLLNGHRKRLDSGGGGGAGPEWDQAVSQIAAASQGAGTPCGFAFAPDSEQGIYAVHHGFADAFREITAEGADLTAARSGRKIADEEGLTSGLRLFGDPAAAAPTLVFGDVDGRWVRRSNLVVGLTSTAPGSCPIEGSQHGFGLFRLEDHTSPLREILQAGFPGGDTGTKLVQEPLMRRVGTLLDPRGAGVYLPNGTLSASDPETPPDLPQLTSELAPWLAEQPLPDDLGNVPDPILERMRSNDFDVPGVFTGPMVSEDGGALARYVRDLLFLRSTFQAFPDRALGALLDDHGALRVPGVTAIVPRPDQGPQAELRLPEVTGIEVGGTLLVQGRLVLTGDIRRGGGSQQPLTLVASEIVIEDSVEVVEAALVVYGGPFRFPGGERFTLKGSLAAHSIDWSSLRTPGARRQIVYDPLLDPSDPVVRDRAFQRHFHQDYDLSVDGGGE